MKIFEEDILKIPHVYKFNFNGNRYPISGVSTDTRDLKSDEIFFAIEGENFDGHNFIQDAIDKQIHSIVIAKKYFDVNKNYFQNLNTKILVVENTLSAYGILANIYRKKFDIPIFAITGSNGKTTTKEMIVAVLKTQYNICSSEKNENNFVGVPKTLFKLNNKNDIAVLELGTNHIGEIEYLKNFVSPTHSLTTNIGKEHLEFFSSIENIAKEETSIFSNNTFSFLNIDDIWISNIANNFSNKITYSFEKKSDIKCKIKHISNFGFPIIEISNSKKSIEINLQIAGKHNIYNALATVSVAFHFGITEENIKHSLENFSSYKSRFEIVKCKNSIVIIDDTYNSNPSSVLESISTFDKMKCDGKKIIVFGDMLELGKFSEEEHINIGKKISKYNFNCFIGFGKNSIFTFENTKVNFKKYFENKNDLIKTLISTIENNDIILVKGSNGMKMCEIVNSLKEKFL